MKNNLLNHILKDTLKLFSITITAGILLGLIHEVTLPAISSNNEKARQQAFNKAYPEAAQFLESEELTLLCREEGNTLLMQEGYGNVSVDDIRLALDETGNTLGYVAVVTTSEGYGGDITLLLGYSGDGEVRGMDILELNETPGLGTKAGEDPFKSQFAYKKVSEFVYTKMGAVKDHEIDAISGATITTKAVVNAANAGIHFIQNINSNGVQDLSGNLAEETGKQTEGIQR